MIRLSRVIHSLERHFDHTLVHTGQNYDYELNEIFFKDLQIRKPDVFLNSAGESGAETMGNVLINIDKVLRQKTTDAMLVLGDTNSCIAVLPAKRLKIPTFHMEAGNRCFDQRVPEEINRRLVDHLSDINLTYSSIAREYLISEGLPADQIIKTGSPMNEVLAYYRNSIESSEVLEKMNLKKRSYFVVSAHREENIDSQEKVSKLVSALNKIAEKYEQPIIFSAHPRTRKVFDKIEIELNKLISLQKPLGFFDYNKLQLHSTAVLSDSGTISEESSILGFPALNIREAHERPEAMEEAAVMMVGLEPETVLQGLDILLRQTADQSSFQLTQDYSSPNVSDKVARIIMSYTSYVNRVVWKQYS